MALSRKNDSAAPLTYEEERARNRAKLKRKRRIRKMIVFAGFLLFACLVTVPIVIFNVMRVKTVTVRSYVPYTSREIIDACPIRVGDNILFADYEKAEQVLEAKLPYMVNTKITRHLPSRITITADKATEKIALQPEGQNDCLILNENLKILKSSGEVPASATLIKAPAPVSAAGGEILSYKTEDETGKKETASDETADRKEKIPEYITQIIAELEDEGILSGIDYIDLTDLNDVRVVYEGRIMMKLGAAVNLAGKIELGAKVIAQESRISETEKGTIDLTIDKKAYFEPDKFDDGSVPEEETQTENPPEDEGGENNEEENDYGSDYNENSYYDYDNEDDY